MVDELIGRRDDGCCSMAACPFGPQNQHSRSLFFFSFFCVLFSSHPVVVFVLRRPNKEFCSRDVMDTNNSSSSNRQVILEGGLPWGFRIQGGSDTGVQLRIARVSIITYNNHSIYLSGAVVSIMY